MDEQTLTAATAFVAAVATLVGKGGWDYLRSRGASSATVEAAQIADEAKMRGELWAAMTSMQTRMDALQADLDKARREFIDLLGEHALLKAEHAALKREHEALLVRYAALESRVNVT